MDTISESQFLKVQESALLIFRHQKIMSSAAFGSVRIQPRGFDHIEWKNKNHKRPRKEAYVRYLCFHHVPYILLHSRLYQEFREEMEVFHIRKNGKKQVIKKIVRYYVFVAVVDHDKNRVKVVVRKVEGWQHYEFVSVIPVWKSGGYSGSLFFDENLDFLGA